MKSQIPSQMFTYIFTLLVIGMLLFLGVKWVGSLLNQQDEISDAKSKIDIENAFEKIKHSYGSWKNEEFSVPSDVERLCFLDKDYSDGQIRNTPLCNRDSGEYSPIICDVWMAEEQNVVFDPKMDSSINVKDVTVDDGYLCVNNTNNKINVKLTGRGDVVEVSLPD